MIRNVIVFKFFLIFILCSCGNSNNKPNSDVRNEQLNTVDNIVGRMQSNIDSAVVVCDYALEDYKNGGNIQEIIIKYKTSINQLEEVGVAIFKDATLRYKEGELSQASYDEIRTRVFTDSIKAKRSRLRSLGIVFNP